MTNQTEDWHIFIKQSLGKEGVVGADYLEMPTIIEQLAETLREIFAIGQELSIEGVIQSHWAILARLMRFQEFLVKMQVSDEELVPLQAQQQMLTCIYQLMVLRFVEQYQRAPEMPAEIKRSPGFLRLLRDECGLQFVLHYIGFSLRTFLHEREPDSNSFLHEQTTFQESLSYLVEMVIDFTDVQSLHETLEKQRDELTWLTEEIELKRQELRLEPTNMRWQSELQQLLDDYTLERFECDYLTTVIEPIF